MAKKLSFPKSKIKIYLLEKIHPAAAARFAESGYEAKSIPQALQGAELDELLAEAHVVGVRSRTHIRAENLEKAKKLLVVGCFSVGTDQVSLDAARAHGVPVFNAPHSSTRSVAELTLGNILALSRRLVDMGAKMRTGTWEKSAVGSFEVRNKTLGIIGYGHIGQQVGLLAEAIGLNVCFYDVVKKLPLGRAQAVNSKDELLKCADFVSLHVPGGKETELLITASDLATMKPGSFLLNLSRGKVVDLAALKSALDSGQIAGAAVDVYPTEPPSNTDSFSCELHGLDNVIMTPHVGGSTEEAQHNIGIETAEALISFLDNGSTFGAVNFPQVHLPSFPSSKRVLNIHKNLPGALAEVNKIISEVGANIDAQYLSTYEELGYMIMDLNKELADEVKDGISALPNSIRTRILY